MEKTIILAKGDKIYWQGFLCEIVKFDENGEGFQIRKENGCRKHLNSEYVLGKEFEWIIEFTKLDLTGKSHTSLDEEKDKEVALLIEMGWNVQVYREEVYHARK